MPLSNSKDPTELARELARSSNAQSQVYRMSWANEKLLNIALERPAFKAQLFRFVDVFPATKTDEDVKRHVVEYLDTADTPEPIRKALRVAAASPFGAQVIASQARRNIARMAHQFILGTSPHKAVKGAQTLWDAGSGTTIDLLGEKTVSEDEADIYAARVTEMMTELTGSAKTWRSRPLFDADDIGPLPRASISIKPTALASKYKPLTQEDGLQQAKSRIRPMLDIARSEGCLVWFDMESYDVKDVTIRLFTELMDEPDFKELEAGLVIQAYLRDSHDDLSRLIEWSKQRDRPVFIRLVKGAYWDTETMLAKANGWPVPVFERKVESDANYERCTRLLLDNHGLVRSAFASHNLRSIAHAIAYARDKGLADNAFEVQMLYGMAEPMHEAIRKAGLRLRVYSPVGELVPGMAYLVRRLLENTSNDSFVRMRFAEGKDLDELLVEPLVAQLPAAPFQAKREPTNPNAIPQYEPEPLAQWHFARVRDSMSSVIDAETSQTAPLEIAANINGEQVSTVNTATSVNPADPAAEIAHVSQCDASHIDAAYEAAQRALPGWRDTPAVERAAALFRAAGWLRERRYELAALEVREAAKPWAEADGDVCEAIDFCEYYGRETIRLDSGGLVQSPPGEVNALHYQSRGVGAVISPWNFPLAIPAGMVTAAIAAGNCVLFKPADNTPAIGSKLFDAFAQTGLPRGVLNFVPGKGSVIGDRLVDHPACSFIAFTGSLEVGLRIVERAAKHQPGQRQIKKVIAELGGKNAMIVDSDCDLDQAVPAIVYSAFGYAGQKCSALSRLIVDEKIKAQLLERLSGAVSALHIGAPEAMGTDVGPVIDAAAQTRIKSIIDAAFMWGEVIATRTDLPERGYFVPPTVVDNVRPDSSLAKEEIFGPVLSVFGVSDIDQAITLANDTKFALTAGVFSRSPRTIAYAAAKLRAGNIYVNRQITGAVVGRQPFGGFGLSGTGTKAGGPDYLLHFMEPRVVTENIVRQGFADLK